MYFPKLFFLGSNFGIDTTAVRDNIAANIFSFKFNDTISILINLRSFIITRINIFFSLVFCSMGKRVKRCVIIGHRTRSLCRAFILIANKISPLIITSPNGARRWVQCTRARVVARRSLFLHSLSIKTKRRPRVVP